MHYNLEARATYSPEQAIAILRRSGVRRALVSSTPDESTFALYELDPRLVVPILRTYRRPDDLATWTRDESLVPYLEARFRKGVHQGIGELHLGAAQVAHPVVRAVVAMAIREDVFLHVHGDARTVEELVRSEPRLKILWAHAGLSATADTVGRLVDRYPTLWVELAIRTDVAPGGALDPSWRALFLRRPDRFLAGTDTYVAERWELQPEILGEVRGWLRQLPSEVAERIAHGNGEALFGPP